MPTPSGLVVKNGSKIRGTISGAMPAPVSRTSIIDAPALVGPGADADLVALGLALGDGLRGVEEQVQEHLAEARLVAVDQRHVAVVLHQARAVADLVPGHVDRRVEHAAHDHRPARLLVAAREDLEVAHDVAHPLGALARLAQRLDRPRPGSGRCRPAPTTAAPACRGQRRQLPPREVDVRDDVRERVVDLVRHARRQRPDRRHAPGEDQLLLHLPALGEVADEEVVAFQDPGGRPDDRRAGPSPSASRTAPSFLMPTTWRSVFPMVAPSQIGADGGPVIDGQISSHAVPSAHRRCQPNMSAKARLTVTKRPSPIGAGDRLAGVLQRGAQLADLLLPARDHAVAAVTAGIDSPGGWLPADSNRIGVAHPSIISASLIVLEVTFSINGKLTRRRNAGVGTQGPRPSLRRLSG